MNSAHGICTCGNPPELHCPECRKYGAEDCPTGRLAAELAERTRERDETRRLRQEDIEVCARQALALEGYSWTVVNMGIALEEVAAERDQARADLAALMKVVEQVLDWNICETQRYSMRWGVDWLYVQNKRPDVTALASAYLDASRAQPSGRAAGEGEAG